MTESPQLALSERVFNEHAEEFSGKVSRVRRRESEPKSNFRSSRWTKRNNNSLRIAVRVLLSETRWMHQVNEFKFLFLNDEKHSLNMSFLL
jgi:hypothetical protein